jgi:tetratricopeptide (TPR) repeat protein
MQDKTDKINPYDWINPIDDPKLFAGRKEELSKIMDEILRIKGKARITPIVAVTGERRVGKTSLLLRIKEKCQEDKIKSIVIPIEKAKVENSWEFWGEIFNGLLLGAVNEGIDITGPQKMPMGFTSDAGETDSQPPHALTGLMFPKEYEFYLSGARVQPSTFIIQNDFEKIIKAFQEVGFAGLILILDEAHILLDSQAIKQQIRNTIQNVFNCGIVFAGETRLSHMFTNPSEPFFGQANVIPLGNFIDLDEVVECAVLPLKDDELKLISPMTIQYIARLSRGKPNQIRLICSSIYKRYANGKQKDLNITIDVLDDVLENVAHAYEDPDLKDRVRGIQRLDSVDLELLYNMTRYPNWNIQDIIELDESFRGDCRSNRSISRRKDCLEEKHRQFVQLGLLSDDKERYQLVGGEFISLYLRFFYETRKYGKLSKRLILGKGPPTLFGEITEKLVRSLAYHFGQTPELQCLVFHQYHRDFGDIIERVKRRFSVLEQLRSGKKPEGKDLDGLVLECFTTCELIGKEGNYYLLCLSVRNRDNPRQVIQVELYFDLDQNYVFDLVSLFKVLNQQAEDARVLIEGYGGFWVELPDLIGLLNAAGIIFEDLLKRVALLVKWHLSSIQHLLKDQEKTKGKVSEETKDADTEDEDQRWIELYAKGEEEKAEEYLVQRLARTEERSERARLYNDLGYIRCGNKLKEYNLGRKDLETAFDLHFTSLPLTLLNLSYLDLEEGNYKKSIEKINATLLLTLSPIQTKASYLRLRLPENHLAFRVKCEQHPANVIESAYINLAYAILKFKGYEEAFQVLEEASELFPSSIRLKHALARLYIQRKRVDLALPIYKEISQAASTDKYMEFEVKYFQRHIGGGRKSKRRGGVRF